MDKRNWLWKKKNPTDEKITELNEKLLAADHLVKQHAKVAEEAVAGWEKSKAETLSLKDRLDQLMEQKQASDDQISRMDGALKETTWKLREIQEDQEQKLHDAIGNKTRDWENLRLELQERLEDADHQLVETEFQNSLLFKRVQEQSEALLQLGEACSNAEAKVEMLQVQLEIFETENASFKYEVVMLKNELAIRNQERDINKRSLDVAGRQKAESVRRISKLEIECQKLRALVRKKLPGPGALEQMKLEAEGLDDERGKCRQGSQTVASSRAVESLASLEGTVSKQLTAMEEETKMLKEVLAERNTELHTARTMSARMAERLSTLERQQAGQAENLTRASVLGDGIHGVGSCIRLSSYKECSHASHSEDGVDDEHSIADSWASALISELAGFSKERATAFQQPKNLQKYKKVCDHLDSTDDFIEVERLVSVPPEQTGLAGNREGENSTVSVESLAAKEAQLQTANMHLAELKGKLVLVEEQLRELSSKNAANELNLFGLRHKLDMIITNLEVGDEAKAMEEVRSLVLNSKCSSIDGLEAHIKKHSRLSSSCVSAGASSLGCQRSSLLISDEKPATNESELTGAVKEVVHLVEELAYERKPPQKTSHCEDCLSTDCIHSPRMQNTSELDCKIKKLKSYAQHKLQGNSELVELIKDLSSVLYEIKLRGQPVMHHEQKERHKRKALKSSEQEVFSDTGSPFSNKSNCDGCALPSLKVSPAAHRLSISREYRVDEEVRKLCAEKAALEAHMKAEFSRVGKLEAMLVEVQNEKSQLIIMLEEEKEKLEGTKSQVLDDEQLIANQRVRLASIVHSKNMADDNLSAASLENSKLVLQLQECQMELTKWHEMVKCLERNIVEKQGKSDEFQAKVEELQGLLESAMVEKSNMGIALNAEKKLSAEKSIKEEAMMSAAEQLAECQRTILDLGKQIQSMATARASISCNSSGYNSQEGVLSNERFGKEMEGCSFATTASRVCYDLGDFSMSDLSESELVSAAEGKGSAAEKPSTDEGHVEAVSRQLRSSPESENNAQIVPYVPPGRAARGNKSSARRPPPPLPAAAAAVDLAKSQNLGSPSSSSPKRGNSFSRFFGRNRRRPSS